MSTPASLKRKWPERERTYAESADENKKYRERHGSPPQPETTSWTTGKVSADYFRFVSHVLANRDPSAYSVQKFAEVEKTDARQDRELKELRERLERLESVTLGNRSRPRDPYAVWVESEAAKPYAGFRVAFVPGVGPIEKAKTTKELKALIKNHPLKKKVAFVTGP